MNELRSMYESKYNKVKIKDNSTILHGEVICGRYKNEIGYFYGRHNGYFTIDRFDKMNGGGPVVEGVRHAWNIEPQEVLYRFKRKGRGRKLKVSEARKICQE